jgi:hypothetical protein
MATRRTRSITTKLTEEEYAQVRRAAGEQTVSEWARSVLLKAHGSDPSSAALLQELWAFRFVLTNALPALTSEAERPALIESITAFIHQADQKKSAAAKAMLEGAR